MQATFPNTLLESGWQTLRRFLNLRGMARQIRGKIFLFDKFKRCEIQSYCLSDPPSQVTIYLLKLIESPEIPSKRYKNKLKISNMIIISRGGKDSSSSIL